ncbi:4,5-DOPA dioxygenase extradiol [Olsenella sp. KH3B4]|uniref:dioxygenase family protein n=1 Tax=Olsenella sp. KH3B4 TaxID=1855394 RepID=UPI0008B6ED62|nr:class III extradiol ring-cleavage dioxygenase [Olsenella sp. KH3B4]SET19367.1 4,5-DOPA dioxygenase extradiol [Olsenella sp. KH3B4]
MANKRQMTVFVGHGDPMMALRDDEVAHGLRAMGEKILADEPRAILAVSAHWFTRGTLVQSDPTPRQVNDMYGFPPELYAIKYRPAGSAELTARVRQLLGSDVEVDDTWGIDHGVWTPLHHMLPKANVPVVELSVNGLADARYAYDLGRRLVPLRDEGFVVLGSGNVVHNLREADWNNPAGTPACIEFDSAVRAAVEARDDEKVIAYERLPHASYAVPTPDHYLPLLTVLGASEGEKPEVFNDVRNLGAISMTSYAFA